MTTGQRVAQKRKELGLSQEALGEKLGVSRQSIYKWESDSALPEIEKLVALSRLFGVSVGWLLGVEEEPSPGGAELTEAQLNMVEEIAARYAPKPRLSPRRLAVVKVSVIVAVLCLCGVFFGFYRQLNRLTESYYRLYLSVSGVQNMVDARINGVSNRLEDILKAQDAITAGYGTSLVSVDPSQNSAAFQAYAMPKTYIEGMTAEFYENGGRTFPAREAPGHRFEADLECGLAERIALSVSFVYPDGSRQNQLLDEYTGLYGQTFPAVRANYDLVFIKVQEGGIALEDNAWGALDRDPSRISSAGGAVPEVAVKALRVGLFKNKKLVDWAVFTTTPGTIEEETSVLTGEQWREWPAFYFPPQKVPVEAGDALQVAVVIQDIYGRTAVRVGEASGLDEGWNELHPLSLGTQDTYPDGWMLADGSPLSS